MAIYGDRLLSVASNFARWPVLIPQGVVAVVSVSQPEIPLFYLVEAAVTMCHCHEVDRRNDWMSMASDRGCVRAQALCNATIDPLEAGKGGERSVFGLVLRAPFGSGLPTPPSQRRRSVVRLRVERPVQRGSRETLAAPIHRSPVSWAIGGRITCEPGRRCESGIIRRSGPPLGVVDGHPIDNPGARRSALAPDGTTDRHA